MRISEIPIVVLRLQNSQLVGGGAESRVANPYEHCRLSRLLEHFCGITRRQPL